MKEKTLSDTQLFANMVATKQGWKVNPDTEFVQILAEGLTTNYNRYGYFLCPCRDSDGSRETDKDMICPCAYARSDIEEHGHCYCSLYLSEAFYSSGKSPQSIRDKRYS